LNSSSETTDQSWNLALGDDPGVVILTGEIDFSGTPKVRERLLEVLAGGAPEIRFDLSGLSYIDSSGLALLLEMRRILTESGRTLRITALSPQVRKLFNLTQLGDLFGLPE
jgi:anti-sigma B factor antagonist